MRVWTKHIGCVLLIAIAILTAPLSSAVAVGSPEDSTAGSAAATASEEVYVPAGEYLRGCTSDLADEADCALDARPLHAVYVDGFYIDVTEVTNEQYAACVAARACRPPLENRSEHRLEYYGNPQFANYPVLYVDWTRADTYCRWVGRRLPTEAEWEKTARGTDRRLWPWGNDPPTCQLANVAEYRYFTDSGRFMESYCVGDTAPVGSYPEGASPYGALDMAGNVREWVNDLYEKFYYRDTPYFNPKGPDETVTGEHLVRGGSWWGTLTHANTWARQDEADIYEHRKIGFRCARSTDEVVTPTPTPEPVANAVRTVSPEGGALWISPPDHLTLLVVPRNSLVATTTITLTERNIPSNQGDLQGIDHFFSIAGGGTETLANRPLQVALAYGNRGGVIEDTLNVYRASAGTWVTDAITTRVRYPGYVVADIEGGGTYGLLGETHRVYLPSLLRR